MKRVISILLVSACSSVSSAQPTLKNGFPISLPRNITNGFLSLYIRGVNIVDVNQDRNPEIVIGSGHNVFVIDRHGQNLSGWPRPTDYIAAMTPAIGDLDHDGKLEIVALDRWISNESPSRLYAWHQDGTAVSGFPILSGILTYGSSSPILYDLDKNGQLSIIAINVRVNVSDRQHEVFIFNHQGEIRENFPARLPGWAIGKPALGDVDGDERPDIISISATSDSFFAHAILSDGIFRRLWQHRRLRSGHNISGPSLAELDQKPGLDIVFTEARPEPPGMSWGMIHAINGNGMPLPGFPADSTNGQRIEPFDTGVSFADINADGVPEIFAVATDQLVGLHADGTTLPGWPQKVFLGTGWSPQAFAPLTIGEIDGDGVLDIFTGDNHVENGRWGLWHIFDIEGRRKEWSPMWVDGLTMTQAAFTDLEQDGALDIVFVSFETDSAPNYLWAYSMGPGTYDPTKLPWPQYGHDRHLSSQYNYVPTDIPVSVHEPTIIPARFELFQNYPNPFSNTANAARGKRAGTVIRYELSEPAEVYLRLFNLLGEEMWLWHFTKKSPGQHEIFWEGRDRRGQALPPGLYFYRLEVRSQSHQSKTILLTRKLVIF